MKAFYRIILNFKEDRLGDCYGRQNNDPWIPGSYLTSGHIGPFRRYSIQEGKQERRRFDFGQLGPGLVTLAAEGCNMLFMLTLGFGIRLQPRPEPFEWPCPFPVRRRVS